MSTQANSPQKGAIQAIEAHIERLISEHKNLTLRNRELLEQCEELKASKRALQQRLVQLERELSKASLISSLTTLESVKGADAAQQSSTRQYARAYVNRLMREIDACLSYIVSPEEIKAFEENDKAAE